MANMNESDLIAAAEDILTPLGYEVLELVVTGSGNKRVLLLRFDRLDEAIVSMDDVALVTEVFSLDLDRLDPFEQPYKLNVTSPGSERPLFKKRHFERFHDLKAKIKVGREQFKAVIRSVNDEAVELEVNGEIRTYTFREVQARLAEWPDTPR